jgi:alpha/beta superfamily hydrolase
MSFRYAAPLLRLLASSLLLAGGLAACGGGMGHDGGGGGSGSGTPARGTLLHMPSPSTLTAPSLLLKLNLASNAQLFALSGNPVCDVLFYDIQYETIGGANEPTTASAALMVPTGLGASCTGSRPIVLYAHGTTTDRAFTMTNTQNAETLFLAALFATKGYIVVAPNYAGYDTSSLTYHPYLVAEQQSADMMDALAAARSALPIASVSLTRDDGRLYITGYSQGGYVAMATQRAMQSAGMAVTAAAPMSGPYALAAFVDAVFYGEVNGDGPVAATLLVEGYQHAYGNLFSDPAQVFASQYAPGIETLFPSTTPRSQIYAQGKLPEYALFSPTPPAPQYADITPPMQPASLADVFAVGFGPNALIENSYRLSYLEDAAANPDGGFPTRTTGVPAPAPALPLRADLRLNDLRDFSPQVATQLCGGDQDPIVFWMNTELMQAYWAARANPSLIGVLDLEAPVGANDAYGSMKSNFELAKQLVADQAVAQGASDGGKLAVTEAYHAALVAPFCFAATKDFFDNHP